MNKLAFLLSIIVFAFVSGCNTTTENPTPTPTPTETLVQTLVNYPWKVDKVTDANGNIINPSTLPAEANALFSINIQFSDDKTVRALDPVAKTVVNGGKWDFLESNKILDIDISQLKGQFPIVSLKKDRMILKNKVTFGGLTFDVNLELVPSI